MGLDSAFGRSVTRRGFLGMGVAAGGAVLLGGRMGLAADAAAAAKTDIWVLHGTDKKKLMASAMKIIADNGGFGKAVKKLTLKVNAAWWRTPEQGANTHPELVDAFLKGCKDQGIKELVLPENACDPAKDTFPKSGILEAAKSNGVPMIDLQTDPKQYKEVELPSGKKLKAALVGKDFLETDALVNMPVAKHHGAAEITMAMKNWMGAVKDRSFWHRNDLHQCIADFATFIKPAWTIIDATRIMLDKGPKGGPGANLKELNLLILAKDQVAADVYTASLFPGKGPDKVKYLTIAAEMKLGATDPAGFDVHKMEVG
jgi:uncharacterized protein (DUF362 family)